MVLTANERALVEGMLEAYRAGCFPMGEPATRTRPERIGWFSPDPRAVIPLEPGGLRVSRSLRQRVRSGRFTITADGAFGRVIRACAAPRPRERRSWITPTIIEAYTVLHRAGHAHSVEAWVRDDEASGEDKETRGESDEVSKGTVSPCHLVTVSSGHRLVGGLYGVHIGGAFFGESMFSRPDLGGTDASKVCLVHLVAHLRRCGFALLDTQFTNAHIASLGSVEVPRAEYLRRLELTVAMEVRWGTLESQAIGW